MTTRPIATALLLALAPLAYSPAVRAQAPADDPTTAMARARFKEGVDFYDRGEFEQARASFLQAYALKKHPAVLLNLAWSCLKSVHPLEAERYFKQFLTEGKDITEKQRADANDGLAQARAKLGRIEVVAGAGAEVTIDGVGVGSAPLAEPVVVEAGAHTVKFKSPEGTTDTQSITVMGGEKAVAHARVTGTVGPAPAGVLPLPPPPATESAPPPLPPPPAPAQPNPDETNVVTTPPPPAETPGPSGGRKGALDTPRDVAPVIVLGVVAIAGYAGAVMALVFKQQAQDKADQVAGTIVMHGGCPSSTYGAFCDAYTTDANNVNDDATFGNIALGVGIAATVGTVVYWFAANKSDGSHASSQPVVTPIVGPNVGGFSLAGRF
ncbi:MAG: PEGA domain-containing protein [Polyangiaceae bacterium]